MIETSFPGAHRPVAVEAAPVPLVSGDAVQAGAVSWPAIIAGATGAAALSLILLILGVGLGLSSVSPWAGQGSSATTFGVSTILWVSFTQLVAAGMGGYLAGRLRSRWTRTHSDEVYFRDTAHGFLSWALATLLTAALLTSTIAAIVGGGVKAGTAVAGGAAEISATAAAGVSTPNGSTDTQGYFVDSLFRKDMATSTTGVGESSAGLGDQGRPVSSEVGRIMATAMSSGTLAPADSSYIGQLVAQRTGISQTEADQRVSETFARMQARATELKTSASEAADKARKASAYGALWLFVSLLVGAFCASLAATYGGRQRDQF